MVEGDNTKSHSARASSGLILAMVGAGCASSTIVVPEGHDTYMVARHGTMWWSSSGSAQEAKALQEAQDYCQYLGKQMATISEADSGPGGFGKISSSEVHFRCVAQSLK